MKTTKKVLKNWFFDSTVEKQNQYCARLQGKRNSKYCCPNGKPKASLDLVKTKPDSIQTSSISAPLVEEDGQMAFNFHEEQQLDLAPIAPSLDNSNEQVQEKIEEVATKSEVVVDQSAVQAIKEEEKEYYADRDNFEWEKKSDVENFGEDLKGSARHRRNAFAEWTDRDSLTNINVKIDREILEKQNCPDFMNVEDNDIMKSLALRLCLNEFPKQVPHGNKKEGIAILLSRRKQYLEAYEEFVEGANALIADKAVSADDAAYQMSRKTRDLAKKFGDNQDGKLLSESLYKKAVKMSRGTNGARHLLAKVQYKLKGSKLLDESGIPNSEGRDLVKGLIAGKNKVVERRKAIKKDNGLSEGDIYKNNKSFTIEGTYEVKTPEQAKQFLQKTFRGAQFGNALPDKERNSHMVAVAQSMEDLSKATGLSINDLTQGGTLGIAFAARGTKRGAAHYESSNKVINLTRNNGYGSLAHEIGHALDNNAATSSGSGLSYASQGVRSDNPLRNQSAYSEVRAIIASMRERIGKSPTYAAMSPRQRKYWTSSEEVFARIFEGHVQNKLKKAGKTNTYLVSAPVGGLWPDEDELARVEGHLDSLLKNFSKITQKAA